jgi:hypothetical protein
MQLFVLAVITVQVLHRIPVPHGGGRDTSIALGMSKREGVGHEIIILVAETIMIVVHTGYISIMVGEIVRLITMRAVRWVVV